VFGTVVVGSVVGGAVPASATTPTTVNCNAGGNLSTAIAAAAPGSTLAVSGTCTGNFYIDKSLTLAGPAILDGGGVPTTYGATLNVAAGTVFLNNLVIQNGVGIDGLGGGVWNGGQLTLNGTTVTNNTASSLGGGVFNFGQLTLNGSTVSHNTAGSGDGGGIFNCGASFHGYGLCTGAPGNLILNNSNVSHNTATSGDGGGIANSGGATLNSSIVSGNSSGHLGGGIENNGTATLNRSVVSNNSSTGGSATWSGGGGLSNTGPTTINSSIMLDNSAAWLGGGVFAEGPMTIDKTIVTGNSAGPEGGGLVAWDGPTTVANSLFWNNSDHGVLVPDNPAGVWVAPANFGGFFTNNPIFTTTHSWYR
jgi:hypothetical protein